MQENVTVESDGLKLASVLHVPAGYRGEPLPAFIVCHGFVGSRDESHAQIQADMMEGFGYVALRFDVRSRGESEGERGQVIELPASVLPGHAVIAPILAGTRKGGFNGTVAAIDPAAFGDPAQFAGDVADLQTAIHALQPVAGGSSVLLPGEREVMTQRDREAAGIVLADGTAARLRTLAGDLGCPVPPAIAG